MYSCSELVKIVIAYLNYHIRKKMIRQHLKDMSQLADSARHIEKLNAKIDKLKKSEKHPRKEEEEE
jgi:hypothetical protein